MRTGIAVYCAVCGQRKAPHGRSSPAVLMLCNLDCKGYEQEPNVGCLWPGETEEDFGFPACSRGTEEK